MALTLFKKGQKVKIEEKLYRSLLSMGIRLNDREAIIQDQGMDGYILDVDNGKYNWRAEDLEPAKKEELDNKALQAINILGEGFKDAFDKFNERSKSEPIEKEGYEVEDKVKIKKDVDNSQCGRAKYSGEEVEIERIFEDGSYGMKGIALWVWHDHELEPIEKGKCKHGSYSYTAKLDVRTCYYCHRSEKRRSEKCDCYGDDMYCQICDTRKSKVCMACLKEECNCFMKMESVCNYCTKSCMASKCVVQDTEPVINSKLLKEQCECEEVIMVCKKCGEEMIAGKKSGKYIVVWGEVADRGCADYSAFIYGKKATVKLAEELHNKGEVNIKIYPAGEAIELNWRLEGAG